MALLLLLLLPAGPAAFLVLAGRGFGALTRADPGSAGREARLRGLAALLGAVAAALYTWGLLHVAGAVLGAEDGGAESSPLPPCRAPGQEKRVLPGDRAMRVIDYTVDYVPLRFVCQTTGGGSYASGSVPGYVNPAVLGFASAALLCAGATALGPERRPGKGPAV